MALLMIQRKLNQRKKIHAAHWPFLYNGAMVYFSKIEESSWLRQVGQGMNLLFNSMRTNRAFPNSVSNWIH